MRISGSPSAERKRSRWLGAEAEVKRRERFGSSRSERPTGNARLPAATALARQVRPVYANGSVRW